MHASMHVHSRPAVARRPARLVAVAHSGVAEDYDLVDAAHYSPLHDDTHNDHRSPNGPFS